MVGMTTKKKKNEINVRGKNILHVFLAFIFIHVCTVAVVYFGVTDYIAVAVSFCL